MKRRLVPAVCKKFLANASGKFPEPRPNRFNPLIFMAYAGFKSQARPPRRPTRCRASTRFSGIEFRVPIEIIEPAFVQIVWRKEPPVPMQMVHAGLERHLRGPHARLLGRQIALLEIAGRARGDHVDPGGAPP